jgi:hypothetical protein
MDKIMTILEISSIKKEHDRQRRCTITRKIPLRASWTISIKMVAIRKIMQKIDFHVSGRISIKNSGYSQNQGGRQLMKNKECELRSCRLFDAKEMVFASHRIYQSAETNKSPTRKTLSRSGETPNSLAKVLSKKG